MSKIVIGIGKHGNVSLDLDTLLTTRLLVTADSGGGKTFLLKRICEQAFGKIQIIVVDPEGEFSPLRQKLNFVLVGKGGETPADPRSAALVAQRLLELRASAICDIYEMKPSLRHTWVRLFLDGLIEAPKNLRHPCMVIVDEAHIFDPEHGKGESEASDSMKGLCTRGRKRLLCAVFATQRLATLSKDSSSMLLNRLIGPTFEDVNRKRAAETLSIAREDYAQFFKEIQMLEPGYFFALGRAISRERVLVKVGGIETPHGQEAIKYELKPPPPPDKIKELLPKLADLPKEAEDKARSVSELKARIRELENLTKNVSRKPDIPVSTKVDVKWIESAVKAALRPFHALLTSLRRDLAGTLKEATGQTERLDRMIASIDIQLEAKVPAVEIQRKGETVSLPNSRRSAEAIDPRPVVLRHGPLPQAQSNGDLKGPHLKILRALAELKSIGKDRPVRAQVAAWAGYSPRGGAFGNPLGNLRTLGFVDYPASNCIQLTDQGETQVGVLPAPDQEEIHRRVLHILDGPARKILKVLLDTEMSTALSRANLAERAGYEEKGGAFGNPLGALHTAGFVEYPERGMVKAADWLFV